MNALDKKRKIFDIKRLETAKMEMELKIAERLDEIERIKENILKQEAAIKKLEEELSHFA